MANYFADTEQVGPFCWCGHAAGRHEMRDLIMTCGGCMLDDDDDDINPYHDFEEGR